MELIDPSKIYELEHMNGVKFQVKHWTVAMQDEVDRRCLSISPDGKVGYDTALEREMRIDMSVIGWSGITMNNPEAPCDSKTKKKPPPRLLPSPST